MENSTSSPSTSSDDLVASLSRVPAQEHRSGFYRPDYQARAQEMGCGENSYLPDTVV